MEVNNILEILKHAVFTDVESAGLDPENNGILSIGATTINDAEFYGECHLYSFQNFHPKALEINGFTYEQVWDISKRDAHTLSMDFVKFCKKHNVSYLIGKNARWDYEMIRYPYNWQNDPKISPFPFSYRTIDLSSLGALLYIKAGKTIPAMGISSNELQEYLGVDKEPTPHNGLTGARYDKTMLLKILEKL